MYGLDQSDSTSAFLPPAGAFPCPPDFGADSRALETYRLLQAAGYGTEDEDYRPDLAPDRTGPDFFGWDEQLGGWNPIKSISHAVSSVGKAATSVVKTVSRAPGISSALAPARAALDIAKGKNVIKSITHQATSAVADTRRALPVAAGVVSVVPGVGTGVASGLSAVSAISQGKNLREIAEDAAIGAVPGGQLVKSGLRAGINVARGGNVLKTVASEGLSYARTQLPGGQLAQQALTTGLNVARGGNLVQAVTQQLPGLPAGAARDIAQRALSAGIGTAQGGNVLQNVMQAAPLAKELLNSPMVKTVMNGAALQFPSVGVPAAAAIAATTAVTEAAESTVPGIATAAKQVIANTKAEADRGNQGAAVALGAIKQSIESRMALRQAKARAASVARPVTQVLPSGYRRAIIAPNGQIIFQ